MEKFSDYPQLGRFTLRDEGQHLPPVCFACADERHTGRTIAIGKITKLIENYVGEVTDAVGNLTIAGQAAANAPA